MEFIKGAHPVCSPNQHCSEWAQTYLKYCICNARDIASLTLGLISVISWAVAEVPQIKTNYREKSAEGLSIYFLMTWIVGQFSAGLVMRELCRRITVHPIVSPLKNIRDLFNLIGCLLEPATLPTQYYTALLYTATTAILTAQTIYYGHIYHRLKASKVGLLHKSAKLNQEDTLTKESGYQTDESPPTTASSPIPVTGPLSSRYGSSGRDLYYMSARSLTKSPMPITGSWLAHSRDSGRTPPITTYNRHSSREPLLGELAPAQTKNILCVVSFATFFLAVYSINLSMDNSFRTSARGMVIPVGRKLLQDKATELFVQEGSGSSEIGSLLGWAMAAIYLGGRIPQICLNIRRGNAEGLNPWMFIFALIGNSTYMGSILVNSLEWSKLRPNLAWLVDAGGCVLLDAFIVTQFIYFYYRKPKDSER